MRYHLRWTPSRSTRSAALALCLAGLTPLIVGPNAARAQKQADDRDSSVDATSPLPDPGTTGPTLSVLERRWQVDDLETSDVPIVEEGIVALSDGNSDLRAFDASSGDQLWQAASDPGEPLSFTPNVGSGVALVLEHAEGAETSRLRALDVASDQAERWSVEFDHATGLPYGRPTFTDDGLIVVAVYRAEDATRPQGEQGEAHGFVVLDGDDGSQRMGLFPTDCFAVSDGLVVAPMDTFLGGSDTPRGITAREAATGEERWFLPEQVTDCPVIAGDVVLLDLFESEDLLAVDAVTGEERWRVSQEGLKPAGVGQNVVYVPRNVVPEGFEGILEEDLVQIVALDLSDGGTRWVSVPLEGVVEQIEATDGRVYVAQSDNGDRQGALRVLDSGDGREVGRFELAQVGVAPAGDIVYTVSWDPDADDRGVLRAFDVREVPAVLDVAAMTLTPTDLAEVGLEGYAVGPGSTSDGAAILAAWEGDPSHEVLARAGLRRRYNGELYKPADPADPAGDIGTVITSYVNEFADAEGAAAGFELFEDEPASASSQDLEIMKDLGDGSEVTADEGEDAASGARYAMLDLTIKQGNLHVGVSVVDWSGGQPRVEDVAALGERLLARVATVLERPLEGSGNRVLRLSGEQATTTIDRYLRREGAPVSAYGQEVAPPVEQSPALDVYEPTEVYQVQHRIDGSQGSLLVNVLVSDYLTQEAAMSAQADFSGSLEGNAGLEDLAIEEVSGFADAAQEFSASQAGATERFRGVHMRLGTRLALIEVITPGDVGEGVVNELAREQATCLRQGCLEPVPLPAELVP